MTEWTDVYSSHVKRVRYDDDSRDLFVEWATGKVSAYAAVPPQLARAAMRAWSVGKALQEIKADYAHRYVEGKK